MSNYNLRKKKQSINCNVVQALFILHAAGPTNFVQRDTIADLVKLQMSDQNPKKPIDELIADSLNTLTAAGVLAHTGTSEYGLRCVLQYDNVPRELPSIPGLCIQRVAPVNQRLDPNNPTDVKIKESMCGDNVKKARKPLRCNNKRLPKKPCDRKIPSKLNKVKTQIKKNYRQKREETKKYFTKAFNKIKQEERLEQMRLAKIESEIQEHSSNLSNKNSGHEHNSIKTNLDLKAAAKVQTICPGPSNRAEHSLNLSERNSRHEHNSIKTNLDLKAAANMSPDQTISPVPSNRGSYQGMLHPPDHTSAIGNTSASAVAMFDGPNILNASTIGLNGSEVHVNIPFQRRWSPFWERTAETRVNVDVEQVENQPTWFPMALHNHDLWFGSPFG